MGHTQKELNKRKLSSSSSHAPGLRDSAALGLLRGVGEQKLGPVAQQAPTDSPTVAQCGRQVVWGSNGRDRETVTPLQSDPLAGLKNAKSLGEPRTVLKGREGCGAGEGVFCQAPASSWLWLLTEPQVSLLQHFCSNTFVLQGLRCAQGVKEPLKT